MPHARGLMAPVTVVPIESGDFREDVLADVVAPVEHGHQRVNIVRNGQTIAVVVDPLELQGLEDTVELLSSPEACAAVDQGLADVEAGRVYDADTISEDLVSRYFYEPGRPGTPEAPQQLPDVDGDGTTDT